MATHSRQRERSLSSFRRARRLRDVDDDARPPLQEGVGALTQRVAALRFATATNSNLRLWGRCEADPIRLPREKRTGEEFKAAKIALAIFAAFVYS